MGIIKEYVVTLVATLIFMTAVELIAPDNSMKKYLKFVLGLLLISVLLTPIIKFLSHGEKAITDAIEGYEAQITNVDTNSKTIQENNLELRKQNFLKEFNQKCTLLLENKFKDMKFSSKLDCDIDFDKMTYSVNSLSVYINKGAIKPIEKISIGNEKKLNGTQAEDDETQKAIKDYLSDELDINREKIVVIYS